MTTRPALFAIVLLATAWSVADNTPVSKTVIGPSNMELYEGARALATGDGDAGVRLTLLGLNRATSQREKKSGHANLCAGFLLLNQPNTALWHCNWVLERDPDHWQSYNNRALVYLRLQRFDESAADIAKGQLLNPKSKTLKEVQGLYLDAIEPESPEKNPGTR